MSGFHLPGLGVAPAARTAAADRRAFSGAWRDGRRINRRRGGACGLCRRDSPRQRRMPGLGRARRAGRRDGRYWRPIRRWSSAAKILGKPEDRRDCRRACCGAVGPHPRGTDRRRALRTGAACPRASAAAASRFREHRRGGGAGVLGNGRARATRRAAMPSRGAAAVFVADLRGSYSGVMGLPLFETAELLRRRRAALASAASGAGDEHRDSRQRQHARGARRRGGERRAAGGVSRARQPARPDQQHLQGPGLAGAAGHAGGVHRDRHGAHGVPACLGHFRSAPCGDRHRAAAHREHPQRWSPKATRSWCRWSRIRWAPRARV